VSKKPARVSFFPDSCSCRLRKSLNLHFKDALDPVKYFRKNSDVRNGDPKSSTAFLPPEPDTGLSHSMAAFLKALVTNPSSIGAACPSSPWLAQQIAAFVPQNPKGYVVELGAGTGAVTQALLDRGIPTDKILALERSPELSNFLKKKFPRLQVLTGDACHLNKLLHDHWNGEQKEVEMVVSCLPLRSLPKYVVQAIVQELDKILGVKGRYIQFTYDIRPNHPSRVAGFTREASKVVWRNLPPARVDLFAHRARSQK
jgi:phosphatidylethanolamine/phosphatidyl-N-methylethanolamine N-methyltransferase